MSLDSTDAPDGVRDDEDAGLGLRCCDQLRLLPLPLLFLLV